MNLIFFMNILVDRKMLQVQLSSAYYAMMTIKPYVTTNTLKIT